MLFMLTLIAVTSFSFELRFVYSVSFYGSALCEWSICPIIELHCINQSHITKSLGSLFNKPRHMSYTRRLQCLDVQSCGRAAHALNQERDFCKLLLVIQRKEERKNKWRADIIRFWVLLRSHPCCLCVLLLLEHILHWQVHEEGSAEWKFPRK